METRLSDLPLWRLELLHLKLILQVSYNRVVRSYLRWRFARQIRNRTGAK